MAVNSGRIEGDVSDPMETSLSLLTEIIILSARV